MMSQWFEEEAKHQLIACLEHQKEMTLLADTVQEVQPQWLTQSLYTPLCNRATEHELCCHGDDSPILNFAVNMPLQ